MVPKRRRGCRIDGRDSESRRWRAIKAKDDAHNDDKEISLTEECHVVDDRDVGTTGRVVEEIRMKESKDDATQAGALNVG